MRVLVEPATIICAHGGTIPQRASQGFVTVMGAPVLIEPDPVPRRVDHCPLPPPQKKCLTTITVTAGYSRFVTIGGRPVCLDTLAGLTEGSPVGTWRVLAPGQALVECSG
ncbi:hypothetical protein [Rhodovulum sulfidophilum]|uniref:hypothetical protein n=1 Tax=Rhodovulum sulfidophilum TaxID=35806 RepID=UPI00138A2289|nr:hypothetical protein [Rhodovulum sulfidophilum]NDK35769.1 hypothetical protein [Rhodovulum sulfidophilum]